MIALWYRWWALLLAALVLTGSGCSRKRVEDFTPGASDGRAALEIALRAWKDGHPSGMVPDATKPQVQAVDFEWEAGQKLLEFEILKDELPEGNGPRVFTVRLKTDKGSPREVQYMVLGIDPMLVYRDADYKKHLGGL